jgi:hypothetical protein
LKYAHRSEMCPLEIANGIFVVGFKSILCQYQ